MKIGGLVDEDIDIRDDEAVEWAIADCVNAGMDDVLFFKKTFGFPATYLKRNDPR